MAIDKQRIQELNKMAVDRNSSRQMQLGRQESAKQAYDKAVSMFEAQYGVKITPENLQEVYNSVVAELTQQAQELERKIADVDNQVSESVNKPLGGIDTTQPVQQVVAQPVAQPVVDSVQHQAQPTAQVVQTTQQSVTAPQEAFTTPNAQATQEPLDLNAQLAKLAMTTQATPVVNTSIPTQADEEEAVAPSGWGRPSVDVENVFSNILNNK